MKRLRKHAKSTKIKYYACGEYGSKTERPHYHAIVFNLPRPFDKYILKAWKYGHIHVGTVTEQSIFYTTKYALKGLRRKNAWDYDARGREPEFQLMSNILIHEGNKPTQSEGCILLHNYKNFHRLVNNKGLIVII